MAPRPRAVQTTGMLRSKASAKARLAKPAKTTCQAVELKGSPAAVFHFFESTEPSAQLREPPCNAMDHQNSRRPKEVGCTRVGQMRTTTPKIPITRPILPRREM